MAANLIEYFAVRDAGTACGSSAAGGPFDVSITIVVTKETSSLQWLSALLSGGSIEVTLVEFTLFQRAG
jgi:hypothetical protein